MSDSNRAGETPARAISAFEKLYHRAPNDAERVHLLNIQQAIGLEHTSEWWVFFLVIDSTADRITGALEKHLQAVRDVTDTAADPAQDILGALAKHRQELETLAENIKQDLVQSAAAEAAAASQSRIDAIQEKAAERIAAAVIEAIKPPIGEATENLNNLGRAMQAAATVTADIKTASAEHLAAQQTALAHVGETVAERVVTLVRTARGLTIASTMRAFGIFGGIGAVLGILLSLALVYSHVLPSAIDDDARDWLRWATSPEGQSARQLDAANAANGGIGALAHCATPRSRRDGNVCTTTYLPVQ